MPIGSYRTRLPNRLHLFNELLRRMCGRGWFTVTQFAYVLYLGRKLHCQQKRRVQEKLQQLTSAGQLDMHIDDDGLCWFNYPEPPAPPPDGGEAALCLPVADARSSPVVSACGDSGGGGRRLSPSDELTLRLIDQYRYSLMPGRRKPRYEPIPSRQTPREIVAGVPWSDWSI